MGFTFHFGFCCQTQELNSNGLEEGESVRLGWDEIKNCTLPKKDLDPEAEDPGSFWKLPKRGWGKVGKTAVVKNLSPTRQLENTTEK